MDVFNPHSKDNHDGTEIVQKQKKEYKFIGSSLRRRGQKLWRLDEKTLEVHEVVLQKKKVLNMKGDEKGQYRAIIKASNPILWALNKNNAIRKFIAAAHKSKRKDIEEANG